MKKKITLIFVFIFAMLFTLEVKAEDYSYYLEREGESWSQIDIPMEIKSGDIITIRAIIDAITIDNSLLSGSIDLVWDDKVFEILKYDDDMPYCVNNSDFENMGTGYSLGTGYGYGDGYISVSFATEADNYLKYGKNEIMEFKFKVLDNISNGVYTIKQIGGYLEVATVGDDDSETYIDSFVQNTLSFQVGEAPTVTSISSSAIGNNTYIIGNHLFTREGSDEYNGILTTDYIMLASKSITSDDKKDMIVYLKNARGNWVNAITDESVTPPDNFEILYSDMKQNYKTNGIYVKDDVAVTFVELDENFASVMIENDKVYVKGIATITNNVATLKINENTYSISIGKEKIELQTNDEYLSNCELTRKYSYTINDLYEGEKQYLNSKYNGKYILDDKEFYVYQESENKLNVYVKKSDEETALYSYYLYLNSDNIATSSKYKIEFNENTLTFSALNGTSTIIDGTYTRDKKISMEDIIKIWTEKERKYAVVYDFGEDITAIEKEYCDEGDKVHYNPPLPTKFGYKFIEWQLDGFAYNFDTPVTKPITLVAKWEKDDEILD